MAADSLYVMSPIEIVFGYLFGHIDSPRPPVAPSVATSPRDALEDVVRAALQRPPCGVAFSGGRDSSVVLAVATHVARRDGLPAPVPITKVFPQAPATDERHWQELVLRHLRIDDWERVVLDDELDLVGPLATANLREHGVLWPPTIHGDVPVVEQLRGGSLLDGEGGDEVLGVAAHRIAPVAYLLRTPRRVRWHRLRIALRALLPSPLRVEHARRRADDPALPWLRPPARAALAAELEKVECETPLSFAASVRRVPRRRTQVLGAANRQTLARRRDVELSSPLLDPAVVDALARDGGVLGRGDRTTTLRAVVPDLLPDAVLARTSKAEFSGAFWSRHARQFARRWDGTGVDTAMVDPQALQRLWCSASHNALTSAMLQQAWLSDHRRCSSSAVKSPV